MFILHQLLRSSIDGVASTDLLKLEVKDVWQAFTDNCIKGESLVGMIASGLLSDMLELGGQTTVFIR